MPGKISYFKNGIKQTAPTLDVEIIQALEAIRSDEYRDVVEQLRSTPNKEVRQVLKRSLGYYTFSGTFRQRNADKLIEHSGVLCIDLDDLTSVSEAKDQLVKDPYVLACFVSPSGTGLKLLFRIDPTKHLESFKGLEKYFLDVYQLQVDPSGKDVSRACYVSYDPELFIHDGAQVFTAIIDGDFSVDYESGEVIENRVATLDEMDAKTRNQFERAEYVVEQIVKKEIDITSDYETWIEVGMALATFGEVAKPLFDAISQFHPDYKPREINYKFDNFLKTTRFKTPAKFFAVAKNHGINTSKPKEVGMAIAEGAGRSNDWQYKMPDDSIITDELKEQTIQYGFIEYNNVIYMAEFKFSQQQVDFKPISNYVLRPLFLILSKSDPKRLFEIKNIFGHKSVIDMPTKAFVSVQAFCELTESQGNFLMEMSKSQFHKLKVKWYEETKNAEEIKTLGWHKDGFYCFANGIFFNKRFHGIDEYGMITRRYQDEDDNEKEQHYFIPAMSDIYRNEESEYEAEKKFVYIKGPTLFSDWAKLYCDVHQHNANGSLSLCWFMASIFRDFIYDRFKFFPHLFGFGPPGTGKSTLGWSISYLFGIERKPFNLNAGTSPGFYRTFAQCRNAVVWFDEYSNGIDIKRIQDLKNAYDGAGHVKGDWSSGGNSNRTVTTPVHSGCYISGQELPIADNALFKRCILLQFYQSEYTAQAVEQAKKLREIEERSLSYITAGLTSFRQTVEANYHDTYDLVLKELKAGMAHEPNIEERIIHNMCICVTMYKVLENELKWPFSWDELKREAVKNIISQNLLISKAKETSQFWDTVQYLYASGLVEDEKDFCITTRSQIPLRSDRKESIVREFDKPTDLFVFSLNRMHTQYRQALRQQGETKGMDRNSLLHYLQHSRGYIGAVNKINYGSNETSGYVMDYATLEDMGYDFRKPLAKRPTDVTLPKDKDEKEDLPF